MDFGLVFLGCAAEAVEFGGGGGRREVPADGRAEVGEERDDDGEGLGGDSEVAGGDGF